MKVVSMYVKRVFWALIVVGILTLIAFNYSYVFSRTVLGRIENVARVTEVTALVGGRGLTESQMYSFSISIRQPDGELLTATSEDRQWAVVKSGACVKAKYYPYPPWDLKKADTYFNARLITMADCSSPAAKEMGIDASQLPPLELAPSPTAAPAATPGDSPGSL